MPVGADINPVIFRITGNHCGRRAEILTAIEGPHPGGRKLGDIDIITGLDVLVHQSIGAINFYRRLGEMHLVFQNLRCFQRMIDRVFADGDTETIKIAADHVIDRFVARMTFDIFEQECRTAFFAANHVS